jgi:hypothetical protein
LEVLSPITSRAISGKQAFPFKYSICTLVTNPDEYQEMLQSFVRAGFDPSFCEFLHIDNSKSNTFEAYSGLNKFLQEAQGKYIILCHQDILLNYDNLEVLEKRIEEIETMDPRWAIIGNAGAVGIKNKVYRISEGDGVFRKCGHPPAKVVSVDENFILVKKEANLALSGDLSGFHLYGTDLCIIASILGYNAYVVNFHLLHKSKGNADKSFFDIKKNLIKKYSRAFAPRFIETTMTKMVISSSSFLTKLLNTGFMLFWVRQYFKLKFRKDLKRKIE